MGFLSDFEGRVSAVFSSGPRGYAEPFSFKKLARRAGREMEKETLNIDGDNVAPALFTVLVSPTDDALMRPLYEQIVYEVAALVSAQAQKKGYSFVGSPLVRFMVDNTLKSGKFAVFAENVDLETLEELRREEAEFLSANSRIGGAASQFSKQRREENRGHGAADRPLSEALPQLHSENEHDVVPRQIPEFDGAAGAAVAAGEVALTADGGAFAAEAAAASSAAVPAGSAMPSSGAAAPETAFTSTEQPDPDFARPHLDPVPLSSGLARDMQAARAAKLRPLAEARTNYSESSAGLGVVPLDFEPMPVASASESTPMPLAGLGNAVAAPQDPAATMASEALQSEMPAQCILIDRSTGRTFSVTAPEAIIGRERSLAQVILRDPNVSRQHARLIYDGASWHISDLHSTNGTLVNDIDVEECSLRNGDLITVGLVNLEFREVRA